MIDKSSPAKIICGEYIRFALTTLIVVQVVRQPVIAIDVVACDIGSEDPNCHTLAMTS
jgi:hypothetical protein